MESLFLKALGLGLAGFDPSGALIAVALIGAGATRRAVALFCMVYLIGSVTVLTAIAWVLRTRVPGTDLRLFDDHPATKAGAELAVGIALLAVALHRFLHRNDPRPEKRRQLPVSAWATAGIGIALAIGVVGDPALLAFAVVASTASSITAIVVAQIIAVAASKILVVAILVVLVRNQTSADITRVRDWWQRAEPRMNHLLSIAVVIVGLALIANALWWYANGTFLLG